MPTPVCRGSSALNDFVLFGPLLVTWLVKLNDGIYQQINDNVFFTRIKKFRKKDEMKTFILSTS